MSGQKTVVKGFRPVIDKITGKTKLAPKSVNPGSLAARAAKRKTKRFVSPSKAWRIS